MSAQQINTQQLNMQKVEQFAGQVVTDISATISGVMTNIGHKLGLYKAMAGAGHISAAQLAEKTSTHERYVREWLNNQTAGSYVFYDSDEDTYLLPDEHAPILAFDDSPVFLVPALEVVASLWADEDKILGVFKSGEGMAWAEHNHRLFCGSEALFRPGYKAHLTESWLQTLDGMEEKLIEGINVADVGCGHGASTIVMAEKYPNSTFYGFDNHLESIELAKQRAEEAGVIDNIHFILSDAKSYEDHGFGLICFMDCLHDMGDPVGAAAYAKKVLNDEGSILLVEPAAADDVNDNINPVSRLYYAASTAVCTPCSLSQEVGYALGAQAGQKKLSDVMKQAGFTHVEKTTETPFNIILEVRK